MRDKWAGITHYFIACLTTEYVYKLLTGPGLYHPILRLAFYALRTPKGEYHVHPTFSHC